MQNILTIAVSLLGAGTTLAVTLWAVTRWVLVRVIRDEIRDANNSAETGRVIREEIRSTVNGKIDKVGAKLDRFHAEWHTRDREVEARLAAGSVRMNALAADLARLDRRPHQHQPIVDLTDQQPAKETPP